MSKTSKSILKKEQKIESALRFNVGKPQWGLVHYKSLEPMVKVLE